MAALIGRDYRCGQAPPVPKRTMPDLHKGPGGFRHRCGRQLYYQRFDIQLNDTEILPF